MRASAVLTALLGLALTLPAAATTVAPEAPTAAPASADAAASTAAADDAAVADPAAEAAAVAAGKGPANLTRADLEAFLDGYLPYALARGDIPGAVVVVVKDGQVLLQKGYGVSDLETGAPVDPDATLFRPGSVSKLFTWTAVMQLVEQGKLDLDADVNTYLDFKIPERDGKPVTLRNIMTHTTGMEEQIRGLIHADPNGVVPLGEALKHWVPERIFEPGSTPAYSNYATALAGYIIERVSGETFDDYIDNHIFAPLGMRHASFRQPLPPELLAAVSKGYAQASDGEAKPYEFINLAPAGSLAATGADMGRFMIAHLQDGAFGDARILKPETARQMHETGQVSVGPLNRMMLGFYETTINGHRAIAHGGDTQWFHSDLQLFLDDGVGIFVSMNSGGREGASGKIRGTLAELFANRYLPGPHPAGEGVSEEVAKEHAQAMVGNYDSSRRPDSNFMSLVNLLGQVSVVANEDGSISVPMMTDSAGAPKKWREISPWVWQDEASGERLAADVVDGKVVRFSAEPYSAIMVFQRLSTWRSSAVQLPLLTVSLLALLLTVLAWPVSALVRRHYGVQYKLAGEDARAHRRIRLTALAVFIATVAPFGLVLAMMSDLDTMSPSFDAVIIAVRALTTVVLPLGALLALWNLWSVLTGRRRLAAKLWALVLALACVYLAWLGWATHLFGFSANY